MMIILDLDPMSSLPSLIHRHNAMRDLQCGWNAAAQSTSRTFQPNLHSLLKRELSVLTRTSILSKLHNRSPSPLELFVRPQQTIDSQNDKLKEYYAKLHFTNVTVMRFQTKCQAQHDRRIAKRGRMLGIWIFNKWSKITRIKRMVKDLMNKSDLQRLRYPFLKWKKIFRKKKEYVRFAYSVVRSRNIYNTNYNTCTVCFDIWHQYTKRIQKFRIRLWKISLQSNKICQTLMSWRKVTVRKIKLRHFMTVCLASKLQGAFLTYKNNVRQQIKKRNQFVQKWIKRHELAAFQKWTTRTQSGKLIATNLQRLFHGYRGRKRFVAQYNVVEFNEKLRYKYEEEACKLQEMQLSKKLNRYMKRTVKGIVSVHTLADMIRLKYAVKKIHLDMEQMKTIYRKCLQLNNLPDMYLIHIKKIGTGNFNCCQLDWLYVKWCYDLAMFSIQEAGRKHARDKARKTFRKIDQAPNWICPDCDEGFGLYKTRKIHLEKNMCCYINDDQEEENDDQEEVFVRYVHNIIMKIC